MSPIDSNVDDKGTDDLVRLSSVQSSNVIQTLTAPAVTHFTPDQGAINTEVFILALAYEGQKPTSAPFAQRLWFPVNPEEFSWTQARAVGTYDLLNAPQATQLGSMQVRVFQISGFFPYRYEADFCVPAGGGYPGSRPRSTPFGVVQMPDGRSPQECQQWLALAQKAGYPLQFTAVPLRSAPSIFGNVKVVITSLGTSYRAGNPLDVYYDLELTEYIEPTIVRVSTATASKPAKPPTWASTGKFAGHKYVTRKGDTLISIARAAYGKDYGSLWIQIRAANRTVTYAGKKHSLRNTKGKKVQHSYESLMTAQHIVIPKPKAPKK